MNKSRRAELVKINIRCDELRSELEAFGTMSRMHSIRCPNHFRVGSAARHRKTQSAFWMTRSVLSKRWLEALNTRPSSKTFTPLADSPTVALCGNQFSKLA